MGKLMTKRIHCVGAAVADVVAVGTRVWKESKSDVDHTCHSRCPNHFPGAQGCICHHILEDNTVAH
jgi:hypothetical protein